jgi:hypothetical protein
MKKKKLTNKLSLYKQLSDTIEIYVRVFEITSENIIGEGRIKIKDINNHFKNGNILNYFWYTHFDEEPEWHYEIYKKIDGVCMELPDLGTCDMPSLLPGVDSFSKKINMICNGEFMSIEPCKLPDYISEQQAFNLLAYHPLKYVFAWEEYKLLYDLLFNPSMNEIANKVNTPFGRIQPPEVVKNTSMILSYLMQEQLKRREVFLIKYR